MAVAKVVLKMVTLVFQRVKGFVFYFPSCPSTFDQGDDIVFINGDVGHPTVAVSGLFTVNDTVVKEVAPEWLAERNLWEVQSCASDKGEYLTRPDLGRLLSEEGKKT